MWGFLVAGSSGIASPCRNVRFSTKLFSLVLKFGILRHFVALMLAMLLECSVGLKWCTAFPTGKNEMSLKSVVFHFVCFFKAGNNRKFQFCSHSLRSMTYLHLYSNDDDSSPGFQE